MLEKLVEEKAIILKLKSKTKNKALEEISEFLFKNKYIKNAKTFKEALLKREKQFSTGIGKGIAIPHAQDNTVIKNVVLIAKTDEPIKWESSDGKPIDVLFSIALNKDQSSIQTDILQELAKAMLDDSKIEKIRKARTKKEIIKNLVEKKEDNKDAVKSNNKKLVAVTACPTGIAHTFMAAEAIEKEAQKLGYTYKVEKQGRSVENKLSQKEIDEADVIILAIDKGIDGLERFNNKKVLKVGTKKVIKDSKKCIEDFSKGKTEIIKASKNNEVSGELDWNSFKSVYKNLMGGVSRMLPFIVAGGIILGIGFLLDSGVTGGNFGVTRSISRWFSGLGKLGLGIFVPVLGGYIAYSIIGAEGLMPGFIAGIIASGGGLLYGSEIKEGWNNLWGGLTPGIDQKTLAAGSGFIGAMFGGYIAAAMVMILRKYVFKNVNKNFQGIVSILAIPVLSVLMTGVLMFCAQIPLVYFAYALKEGIASLHKKSLIWLIGLIVGAMMAFDMGGPVNKAAYATATSLIAQKGAGAAEYQVMGAVMITGMVPPIAIAFAAITYRKKAFNKSDIQASYANWLLGAFFITEGAIPFAGKDPKRVIPSIIFGSMISGLIIGLLKVGVSAPHGGIFVFALLKSYLFEKQGLQIGMGILFALGSIMAGMVTGGIMLGSWKAYDVKKGKLVLGQ